MTITVAQLDQALARLDEAKSKRLDKPGDERIAENYRTVKAEVAALRTQWKAQEEVAGNRTGIVGGDATKATKEEE